MLLPLTQVLTWLLQPKSQLAQQAHWVVAVDNENL